MRIFLQTVFVLLISSNGYAESTESGEIRIVKVGVIAPLTGGNSAIGKDIVQTVQLYFERHNKNSKYRVEVVPEDGACGVGSLATTAIQKLINYDKIDFLIVSCSGSTLQVAPIVTRAHIPTIAVYSSHAGVKHLGKYVFRTFIDQERGVKKLSKSLNETGGTVAMITEENAFTVGLEGLILAEIPGVSPFRVAPDNQDFRSIATRLQKVKPEVVYLGLASPISLAAAVTQLRNLGVRSRFFTYLYAEDPSFLEASGPAAEGIRFLAIPEVDPKDRNIQPSYKEFLGDFRKQLARSPRLPFVVAATYNAAHTIAHVSANNAEDSYVDAISTIRNVSGATAPIAYDKNGDIVGLDFVIKEIINGRPTTFDRRTADLAKE